ncbi:MAG TPA: gamma-glutamyl-gamma-aminobutyrate hydrolase family protein, partial [Novosphingobium sp.]|nr:gamma-glutamyl-gamma-aminobutyrate hydrolase family protein [Novosphingobium sp.]
HGKTSTITHDGTGLFEGVPSPMKAARYHSLIVENIPETLVVNARSDDGHVMGFRHVELPIHGVQFHPESIATQHGHAMLANFLRMCGIEARLPDRVIGAAKAA